MSGPDAASLELEAGRTRAERRRLGVFNTPMEVARDAVRALIDRPGTVCDPSCGTGTFLLAAAERLVELGLRRGEAVAMLHGVDIDPEAVSVARDRLSSWAGSSAASVEVGDGLRVEGRFDYVVGNPPYVQALHARFFEHATRTGDAIALVLPLSVLATDDSRAARSAGFGVAAFTPLGRVFDADVDTCVLVLRRDAPVPPGPTWSSLLAGDVPDVELAGARTIGDECEVIAGFRQHFYGLRGHVREGGDGLRLVTSGSIDVGSWSGRPVRFDRQRWDDPRVSLDGVAEPVRSWFLGLLRPKVVVATQTRVIEAVADPAGVVVPSVPVISVVPSDPSTLWHVLAVLLSPPVSAWVTRRWAGTALTPSAVKLGCPHVRSVPLPAPCDSWDRAAELVRALETIDDAAALMCVAYGVGEEVHDWWRERRG